MSWGAEGIAGRIVVGHTLVTNRQRVHVSYIHGSVYSVY